MDYRREVLSEQLQELGVAAHQLDAQLAAVQTRVAAEFKCMGVSDKNGNIREFLYRSECEDAQRNARVLALKIDAILNNWK
ncbi:ORF105 peptide [Hyphantria cunea nucleopolyhedrovirus]|uniref:ORF105 peptide n=1 Tax=Hyphantria cunea nuclear polyhedrosis virus TaxID=28288 RepID=Q2NP06_NPVHC|nr:ORF105 peptide [Hyphantria cunea nucleopolyhedrovirus]BAE72394.1 ORF105 peptide [Hyphantria cunea nucleopolyhedrovirus]